jgi:hypothetical protein
MYYGARFYDPALSYFVSADSKGTLRGVPKSSSDCKGCSKCSRHRGRDNNNSERLKVKWYRWAARAVGELIAVGQTVDELGSLTQVLAGVSS